MTPEEIEKLYIEHAADFRALLGEGAAVARFHVVDARWILLYLPTKSFCWTVDDAFEIPPCLAVAAMTEAWRERLEKEHGVWVSKLRAGDLSFAVSRENLIDYDRMDNRGLWYSSSSSGDDDDFYWPSLAEALCFAVKVLAAEKRKAKAKAERLSEAKTMMGLDPAKGPDFTATITYAPISENRIRQIAREEIDKANKPQPTETKLCSQCGKLMIRKSTGETLCTYPAQYPWNWWCDCGHTEHGGCERGKSDTDAAKERWEEANRT